MFPVKYKLNFYILFSKNSVLNGLTYDIPLEPSASLTSMKK
jgi:hypothetical protein